MKLQIISKLTKNQGRRYDSIRDCVYTQENFHTEMTNSNPKMCEYYSIKTDSIEDKKQNNGKVNLRDFFNNFDVLAEIKYSTVSNQGKEVKRKLEPKLQVLKSSRINAISISKHSEDVPIKEQKLTLNLNSCLDEIRSSLKLQSHHNYHVQRARQKIRKVNSLISLDTQSSTIQQCMRKPGFIKTNRSLAKKQSSLQVSKISSNKQNQDNNIQLEKKASSRQNIQIDNEINESKQRIAKIRKQLNEIYQMRSKPAELKLRLN